MDTTARKVTRDDLLSFGLAAEKHWREFRPKMVKELEAEGDLWELLKEAEDRTLDLIGEMLKNGAHPAEAQTTAMREFILLPPEDDEEPVD